MVQFVSANLLIDILLQYTLETVLGILNTYPQRKTLFALQDSTSFVIYIIYRFKKNAVV